MPALQLSPPPSIALPRGTTLAEISDELERNLDRLQKTPIVRLRQLPLSRAGVENDLALSHRIVHLLERIASYLPDA